MKSLEAPPAPPVSSIDDRETEKRIVEALIFVSDTPITLDQIGQVLPGRTREEIRALVDELGRDLESGERALRIEEVAGGFRFSTRSDLAPWLRTYF